MEILNSYMIAAPIILVYVTILFIVAVIIKDNSIADIAWGSGFIIASVSVLLYQGIFDLRNLLVTALVIIWVRGSPSVFSGATGERARIGAINDGARNGGAPSTRGVICRSSFFRDYSSW